MTETEQAEYQVSDDDWSAALNEQGQNTPAATPAAFDDLSGASPKSGEMRDFEVILDIPVTMTVELGHTKISIRNLLQLAHGSVVELEGLAGEPLDVLINGTLIAQGEVVVVNDKFGIRLTDIVTPTERINKLKR